VVADGELVELGSHRELVEAGGHYTRLYETWRATAGDGHG
jgi:ABC-type multidrug transport system fused ATPase/permease subunit